MKLGEIADVVKGAYLFEGGKAKKTYMYKELSMLALEPVAFLDERKVIVVDATQKVSASQLTRAGDVVVSLYSPMIACYVEKAQEGYVVPHYMSIIRVKSHLRLDSRFIVHFINSVRGRRILLKTSEDFSSSRPTTLPIRALKEVELLAGANNLMENT
ncbi:MAG: Unknown protein [uncultured Sulfurovum sp.]|uniref:Type I restriction modification DNA specificity domain-containing protein n=1 Tax=uncultured Sulfurovum sp. TaxID=269237 RepID=A0A6S6SHD7_9BACT|nr:MAG: Unknown protein [uncultured Sulfurovum sp.]